MLYAIVDQPGQNELKDEMNRTHNKKWYRRLKIIDLSAQGYTVSQLTDMFDLSSQTIRSYIKSYNEGRLTTLLPGYGQGRRCC